MKNEGSFTLKKPKEQRELVLLGLIEDKGLKTNKSTSVISFQSRKETKFIKIASKYNLP